jgi:glucose/arabinose dehydrogenase
MARLPGFPCVAILCVAMLCIGVSGVAVAASLPLERLHLPEGFTIAVFAEGVTGARSLALGRQGTVFVGTRTPGKVYALRDTDSDGDSDSMYVVAAGLREPNGVAVNGADLIVAEVNRLLVFPELETHLAKPPAFRVLRDDLPTDAHHGWKFIAKGPDDKLYVPVGAPCNVCQRDDPRYAAILKLSLDGRQLEVFASGVRNTVGFDWHPVTRELWFTDNGRDMMGDDLPPDELNHAAHAGLNFGFPHCHGKSTVDPEFGLPDGCAGFEPPVLELGAHVAALGMRFYSGTAFPARYRGCVLLAEHGSWNRSQPVGYRVSLVTLNGSEAEGYEPFITGWLSPSGVWGRPVDVLCLPDGSLLISDDYADAVYRVTYTAPDARH